MHRNSGKLKPQIILVGAILIFCAFQIAVSVHKFYNLEASMMDLGDFEQEFWKISHGNWWALSTVFQTPAFAADGSILIYPLAYGFRFLGGAVFLFVVQALGTGLASWGIYRAAILNTLSYWQASAVAMTFLLYPAIIGGSQFDFHPDFIALPLIVWAYVYYMSDRKLLYYIFLALAAFSKNMALFSIGGWGLGLILWKHRTQDGLIALVSSIAVFLAEMDWIIPQYFNGGTEHINMGLYGYLGHGFTGIIAGTMLHMPLVIHHFLHEGQYALWIFAPVLGLSLLGSASVPAMLSLFVLNALSMFAAQQEISNQYQVILSGWVFLALVEALARFQSRRRLFLFGVGLSTAAMEVVFLSSAILPLLTTVNYSLPDIENAVRQIPATDVVWTQNRLGAWVYKFKLLGIAKEGVPGDFVDSLALLWKESGKNKQVPTALLAERPVNPYFSEVMARAVRAGYHVTFHQGPVFILSGSRRFPIPMPSRIDLGWQPSGSSWVIPAWTQRTSLGRIDWQSQTVTVPAKAIGTVFPGIDMQLAPGTYQVAVQIGHHPLRDLGSYPVGVLAIDHHRALIQPNQHIVRMDITLTHTKVLALTLTSTGVYAFRVENFYITPLKPQ